eukprot:gene11839-13977_t
MWERLSPELEYRFSHLNKLVQEQRRYPDSASSSQPTEKLIDYSQANASPHSRRQQADDLANAKADLAVLRGHNASLKASLQATKEDAALAVERSAELQAQIADIRRVVQLSKQVANEKETLVIIRDDAPDSEWWPEHHSSFKKALEQAEDWVVELLGGDWEDTSALVQVMAELLQHSEQLALAAANKAAEAHSLRMDLDEAHRWLECADRGIGGKDDMREKAGKAASSSVKQRDELSLAGLEFKLAAVSGAARNARGSTAGPEAEGELAERSLEKKRVKELEEEVARMQAELARVQATLSETAMSSVEANSHMLKL